MNELDASATLGEALHRQAAARAATPALIYRERVTGYAELDRRANQVANGLAALGFARGARVGYLGKNSDLYFELLFGCARAGVTLVPVNWRLAGPEIGFILGDAAVSLLVLGEGFATALAAPGMPEGLRCLVCDAPGGPWPDFAAWRDGQSADALGVPVTDEDTLIQLYTSGTTGLPKGVELTHRNLLAMVGAARQGGVAIGPDDVGVVCMPVFHIAGTAFGVWGITLGSRVVVMVEFNPADLIALIPRHRVTGLFLVPAAILALVQHPAAGTADFSSVTRLIYGASPIADALVAQAGGVFAQARLYQLYGLTEATGAGTILPPEAHDPARGKLRSCGKPYPGIALRIVDAEGTDVPAGTVGEIVLRSAMTMKGYWNNPAATAAAFLPGGWLRTGDAAYLDDEGFVYVHDRVKDMIVSGGENVYPAEVENAIFGHPAIADVAVIGVPDARWGEAVKAIVVLRPGQEAGAEDILAHARSRIAGFKLPKSIDFVEALPRNASGKVLRRTLRAPYWEGHDRQVS